MRFLYNDGYIIGRGLTTGGASQVIPSFAARFPSTDSSVLGRKERQKGSDVDISVSLEDWN